MAWTKDGTLAPPTIPSSDTPPVNPTVGQLWADTSESADASSKGIVPQGWDDVPIDQSAAIQALIDQAATTGRAWGQKVTLPPGLFYGSFKMRGNVILEGSGWGTTLMAMPGQTAPVIDYETYMAYHTTLRDIRLDGNYVPGRLDGRADATCRVIHMDDIATGDETVIQQFAFNSLGANGPGAQNVLEDANNPYQGAQYYSTGWNDPANRIENVFVINAGGDWAVYVGINQRGTWISDLFIHKSKLGSLKCTATDTQFHNIQSGTSSYGFYVGGTNQQWTQCKSWYVGQNAGYNSANGAIDQRNNGWTVNMLNNTVGALRMVNCEGQDNAGYDLHLERIEGYIISSFHAGGTTVGGVYMHDASYGDLQVHFGGADLTGEPKFFVFDGSSGLQPRNNRIRWTANEGVLSASLPYTFQNGATTWGQDIMTFDPKGNDVTVNLGTGTYTPPALKSAVTITADTLINMPDMGGTDQYMYGDQFVIAVYCVNANQILTWAAGINNAPTGRPLTKGQWYVFRFTYLGTGWYADNSPDDQHLGTQGLGFRNVNPTRAYNASVPTTNTVVYTAPADCTFAFSPLPYFYNPTGGAITVTLKINGITVYTASLGTLGTAPKGNPPPLRPGDTMSVSASAVGVVFYAPIYEVRDSSWKCVYALQPTANTTSVMYTVPAGKRARGIYSANNINPGWVATAVGSNAIMQFIPSGGSEISIGGVAPAANASTVMVPLAIELSSGDALGMRNTQTNASFWLLVQEY